MRKSLSLPALRAVMMVLLVVLGVGNAWAGGDKKYYSNLQAKNGTGEGMVYASQSATSSPEWAATSTAEKQEGDNTFKAYAKAKHGYAFNGWTKGDNTVTVNANTGNGDDIKVTKSTEDNGENIGTVTANWTTASSVNVTYHKPEGGKYTIQYRYDDWNAANNAFESTTSTSLLSENDADKTIATYSGDVITLTPDNSGGNFAGWYSNADLTTSLTGITNNNDGTYTYAVPASASNVYAKFNEAKTFYGQLNVQIATVSAENAGTIYASLLNSTEAAGWTTSTITLKSSAPDAADEYNLLQLPFYLFSQVENITRFAFKGWYSDAACTQLLSADANYTYNLPASSTDKNNPTIQTVYACFGQLVNRYVSVTANVKADQAAQGMVLTSLEEIANPSYTLFAPSSSTVATVATPNSEADATVYLYAQAAYGKKFAGWYDNADCMGAAVSTANPCEYTATAISSDLNNPTVKTLYAKFVDESKVSITYMHPTDGSYSASALHIVDGEWQWEEIYNSGNESADVTRAQYKTNYLTLNANPNAGKGVKSWIDRESGTATITSIEWVRETEIAGARTFGVTFGDSKPFRVESIDYATLADAIAAVNASSSSSVTILVTENAYVAAGNYTLPAKAILLVPYKADQTAMDAQPYVIYDSYNSPTCFRTLTLANGVKLNVLGRIQAGGRMSAKGQTDGRNGTPTGDYGKIVLNEGSKVTLENGSYLYAWGYITGKGTIDAQKGSTTYEFLQTTDWRGGSAISALNGNSQKVFPLHQYFIQNIESPITFRPGAVELCEGTVNANKSAYPFHDVKLVGVNGSGSMFMMDDKDASADTWLRKYYDAATDQQVYEVNSSAKIGSLSLSLNGVPFNSINYVLPITNNMKIHLLTGVMYVTQDTEMLPGSEIEVERGATAYVNENVSLYIFDSDEWPGFGSTAGAQPYFYPLPYTAANGTTVKRDKTKKPKDALLNIHGTFEVNGYLYTTESGANVFSNNEDAGTVIFRTAPTGTSVIYTYNSTASSGTLFTEIVASWMHSYTVNPVWLKNGAGANEAYTKTYVSSTDHAVAGSSYCFINNIWGKWRADGCFMVDDNTGIYYAKPSDYVALKSNTADANHLYHSTDDNLLIVTDGCMWWQVTEVEGIPGLYVWKENPADPNTQKIYYTWDDTNKKWVEKVYTITWKNFDGSTLQTYTNAKYGVTPQYLHGTPTRTQDDYYTYEFSGWTPELIPVTSNSSYTATYTPIERKYKIVFKNGSTTIETVMCGMGITPVCSKEVEGLGVTKEWSPAITAVTGDAIYNLVDMPETYTITFVNWNGTQLQQNTGVEPNTPVSYSGAEPTRAQTTDKIFTFDGWKTATTTYAKNAALPNALQSVTYVAVFSESPRPYTITVSANANGSASGGGSFGYGTEHQITASANAGYGFTQWNDGNKDNPRTISVAGAATYTATFAPLTYFVRYDGNGATSGATTYSTHTYNEAKALTANGFVRSGCAFAGWNSAADGSGTNYTDEQSVTNLASVQDATVTLYAQWTAGTYTVTFDKGTGTGGSNSVSATYGAAMPSITIPTRSGYDFVGYFAETAGAGTQYYNGSGASTHAWNVPSAATLYAHWQPATYSITYVNMEGGDNSENPTFYSRVTSNVTLKNPTKPGCYFGGWFSNAELTSPVSTPAINASTDTGNKTFYAKWTLAAAMVTAGDVTTNYNTVADAITAANGTTNAVVTILQDATITSEITITAAMTIDLNGKTIKSTQAAKVGVFKINASGKTVTITDSGSEGKIDHTATVNDHMYGIWLTAGSLNIEGGTIYVKNNAAANNSYRAYGIWTDGGSSITMSKGKIEATSKNMSFGIYAGNACAITMTGGTITSSGNSSIRGIYTQGTTTLTDATITVTATDASSNCCAFYAKKGAITIHSGTYSASGAGSCYVFTIPNEGQTMSVTINGGRFNGATKEVNKSGASGTVSISGGYYAHNTDLAGYCTTNHHVLATTDAEKEEVGSEYTYKVAEAYKVTFNNYDGTQLQSDYVEKETDPAYTGATPTKAADAFYSYTHCGWTPEIVTVTADATYTAQFSSTLNSYELSWDVNGGNALSGTYTHGSTAYGTSIIRPTNPTRTGYTFNGWAPEVADVMPATNTTYTAQWTPNTNTAYTVKHYQQNIANDDYTLFETENLTGTTATNVTPEVKQYEGFTAPSTQTVSILADGSRVVNYNYTRNSYTLSWATSGDALTGDYTAGSVKYGAAITAPNTPTKTHYTFTEWAPNVAATMPAENTTYTATFTPNTHTLTWDANGGVLSGDYTCGEVAYGTTIVAPTVTREEYVFNGWNTTPASTMPDEDVTYTASWTAATASVTVPGGSPVYYTSLSSAWSAANGKAESTIKLFKNVSGLGASALVYTKANGRCTLDLNNHTISGAVSSASDPKVMYINAAGCTFTITDNSDAKGGRFTMTMGGGRGAYCAVQVAQGTLVMAGGTIYSESSRAWVTSDGSTYSFQADAVRLEAGTSFQMTGGTVEAKSQIAPKAIYAKGNNNITISGGTLIATSTITASGAPNSNPTALYIAGGTTTITGGTFVATTKTNVVNTIYATDASQTVTISGGKFKATGGTSMANINNAAAAANVSIQGGYYSHNTNLSKYKATGYQVKGTTAADKASVGNEYNYKLDNLYTITWQLDGVNVRTDEVAYGETPEYGETPTKASTAQYDYSFAGWTPSIHTVNGDQTYSGSFNAAVRNYLITFVNDDNTTVLQQGNVDYGVMPEYTGETPTTTKTDGIYAFAGWSPEVTEVSGATTYTAQYNKLMDLVVEEGETLNVEITSEVTTTTIHVAGKVHVAEGKTLTTDDLILEATPTTSGEITGAGMVNVTTNAYFHFSQAGGAKFKAKTWYAVAVPWQVNVPANVLGDVYTKVGEGEFVQQKLGKTFDLIYYDGERRAQGATKAWNYVEDDPAADQVMYPGRAYMIYLASDADVIRFKKNNETLIYTDVPVARYASDDGNLADWNGIANPAIYKAYLNVGATENKAQVYNPDTKQYVWFDMSENQLQVGQPIFVQSTVEGTIVANAVSNEFTPASAPRRANGSAETLTRYEVVLTASEGEASDRIIVRMDEDKEADKYIVGQDLAKMGVSSVVPQMWIDRYNSKMCIQTAIPTNNQATYPLSLFAPAAGEYTISMQDADVNGQSANMLYLTYDNRIIWNLTYAPYMVSLNKGTDTHYGLKIVHSEVPAVTTDIEGAVVDAHGEIRKVIIDDKVYIIRGGEIYTITGAKVQ